MKIIVAPNPILNKKSSLIININSQIKSLADLLITSLANKGIGLAAPQIGKNKTIFIISLPEEKPQVFINPSIIKHDAEKQYFSLDQDSHQKDPQPFLEGCLSLPHLYGNVKRWPKIAVQWFDLKGKKRQQELTDLKSIVFQHELDHLKGKLFPQRIAKEGGQLYQERGGQLEKS
jgi:peptide deformylase